MRTDSHYGQAFTVEESEPVIGDCPEWNWRLKSYATTSSVAAIARG